MSWPCRGDSLLVAGRSGLLLWGVTTIRIMKYGEHWEEEIGEVTHYYNGIHVAAVHLDHGRLHVGDKIHIRGNTTDLETTIQNMQVNHHDVTEVGRGAYVGIPVENKVRERDHVYLVH